MHPATFQDSRPMHSMIDAAKNLHQLQNLLDCWSTDEQVTLLDQIKKMMKDHIDATVNTPQSRRSLLLRTSPFTLVPSALTQHTISFLSVRHCIPLCFINKEFHQSVSFLRPSMPITIKWSSWVDTCEFIEENTFHFCRVMGRGLEYDYDAERDFAQTGRGWIRHSKHIRFEMQSNFSCESQSTMYNMIREAVHTLVFISGRGGSYGETCKAFPNLKYAEFHDFSTGALSFPFNLPPNIFVSVVDFFPGRFNADFDDSLYDILYVNYCDNDVKSNLERISSISFDTNGSSYPMDADQGKSYLELVERCPNLVEFDSSIFDICDMVYSPVWDINIYVNFEKMKIVQVEKTQTVQRFAELVAETTGIDMEELTIAYRGSSNGVLYPESDCERSLVNARLFHKATVYV